MELLSSFNVERNASYCSIATHDLQPWHGMSCQYIQLAIKFSSSLSQNIGWTVFLRVDGLAYWFLGFETVIGNGTFNGTFPPGVPTTATGGAVNFTNIVVTPTQTVVIAQAGPMQVNLTFLNPIEVRFNSSDTFDILRICHQSPEIGSSSPSHFRIWPSPQAHWTVQVMLCRCIQMSAVVRAIVL